ncbi:MAG: 4Fe-4S dicluster domain-containing protein [Parvularculaceae bacterium]|nr:4Fe-4S dicluster domain-containing protein [Parvularculaceae bacterium]
MPIHEKSLIRPENLSTHDSLVIDGIDVSGDWSTFIKSRVVSDYNEDLQEEIAALPGGEYIHRCWQCGSCTNSCTVNALNPDFNPRHWIYLVRMGFEAELVRDRNIIWQCVSCNKCTSACPRDVIPEGAVKAIGHWLEHKGYVPKRPSTVFDEVFTEQVVRRGKIEDGQVLLGFLTRTGQSLTQSWLVQMVKNMISKLPVAMLTQMGLAQVFHPRTSGWDKSRRAIEAYLEEKEHEVEGKLGAKQPYAEPEIPVNGRAAPAASTRVAAE